MAGAQANQDAWLEGWVAQILGRITLDRGELPAAKRWLGHAYQLRRDHGEVQNQTNASLTGMDRGSVAWGDYDNDGDLDILLSGWRAGPIRTVTVYRNDGGGTFTDIGAGLTGVGNSSVAWGDYDNDGDLDILLTGNDGLAPFSAIVYRNDGGGAFTDIGAGLTGVEDSSAAWGDYDNDGDLDILLTGDNTGSNDPIAIVYRNDGGGAFSDVGAGLPGVQYSSVAWGDYDNDGDLDILLTGRDASLTRIAEVYRNVGAGTFITETNASLAGVDYGSVAWGDYDDDGDLDILLTGVHSVYGRVTRVYRNDDCAALAVTKQADPDPVQAGSPLTYTIRITNTGSVTLTATVTDTLPAQVSPGGVLTWTPTISVGNVWTQQVAVTVALGYAGPLTNVVQVTTAEGASGIYTATSQAQVTPALLVTKQANPDPVQAGSPLTYTIRITNTGNVDLHATVTDTLPISVTPGATSGGTLVLPDGAVGITWTAFIPAPDGVWMETVVVTVTEGYSGTLTNLVQVVSSEGATGNATVISQARTEKWVIYLPLVLREYP